MKIVFISNFFNHHQMYFSDAMNEILDSNYYFIQTVPVPEERKQLGYNDKDFPCYVKYSYESSESLAECQKIIDEADVAIVGSAPEHMLKNRKKAGKIIFRYAERPLKNGLEPLKYIPRLVRWNLWNPRLKPIYLLCASAYTAGDYRKFGLFKNKAYKWGYFPETKKYADFEQLISQKEITKILWCGRFLDWKHPADILKAAEKLKEKGYDFTLEYIGQGEEEESLRQLCNRYGLESQVQFMGSMKPEQVREHMEKAGIYVFTSDRQEGWGAVLNEAMNSGCAVVASHAIGAVPFLVKNNKNGLVYESGNIDMLCDKLEYLLMNSEEQRRLGEAAYYTILEKWNAEMAAERFLELVKNILAGNKCPDLYVNGPCSRAD